MDKEMRVSFKGPSYQSSINLVSIPAVSDEGKLEWGFNRLELLNILADGSNRSCIRGEGDEKNSPKKEQGLDP